jgi:hypothetical protein
MAVSAAAVSGARGARITPWLLGVATFQVIFGAAVGSVIASSVWLMDAARGVMASEALRAGTFGSDHGYLYSPLTALLIVPATWIPAGLAGGAWLVGRLGILMAGVRHETRGLDSADRVLIAVAATAFLPTLHDLMLGNVSILLAGSVALIAWSPDRIRTGLPLGLALATAPKLALLPILVWMLVFRRRALAGSLTTAAVATLGALAIVGLAPYLAWVDVLRNPTYLAGPQGGNLSLGGLLPPVLAVPLGAAAIVALLFALRRGEAPGLLAALSVGLLVAPYTLAYGAVFLLLAVRPLARVLPTNVMLVVAVAAPILLIVFLPLLAGALLLVTLVMAPSRWPPLSAQEPT